MLLDKLKYSDQTANIIYKFDKTLDVSSHSISLIKGDNGVGKTRFIEGILLKELKANNIKTLYFGQDIENQILSFNLIFLVKEFVLGLKKSGSFFKTIFLNDDSHEKTVLDFNEEKTLKPDNCAKSEFIINECKKYRDIVDVVIFDEADKYFKSSDVFLELINQFNNKSVYIISHILEIDNARTIYLKKCNQEVEVVIHDN